MLFGAVPGDTGGVGVWKIAAAGQVYPCNSGINRADAAGSVHGFLPKMVLQIAPVAPARHVVPAYIAPAVIIGFNNLTVRYQNTVGIGVKFCHHRILLSGAPANVQFFICRMIDHIEQTRMGRAGWIDEIFGQVFRIPDRYPDRAVAPVQSALARRRWFP